MSEWGPTRPQSRSKRTVLFWVPSEPSLPKLQGVGTSLAAAPPLDVLMMESKPNKKKKKKPSQTRKKKKIKKAPTKKKVAKAKSKATKKKKKNNIEQAVTGLDVLPIQKGRRPRTARNAARSVARAPPLP